MKEDTVSYGKQGLNNQIINEKISNESISDKIQQTGCAVCASEASEEDSIKVKTNQEKIYSVNNTPFVCLCDELKGF